MKRFLTLLVLLGLGLPGFAQTHFVPAYSGNPYLAMNIYITEATVNGTSLEAGDEIGIYDGDVCVGALLIEGEFTQTNPLAIVAATDDPTTTEIDGFTAGHSIEYRMWDSSESLESVATIVTYSYGAGQFASQGTVVAAISAAGNQPPEIDPVEDVSGQEDEPIYVGLVASDMDEDALTFEAWTESEHLTVALVDPDTMSIIPALNWFGEDTIYAAVGDGMLSDTTSFTATFTPVNDAPGVPLAVYPRTQTELDTNGVLIWNLSHDPDPGDSIAYELLVEPAEENGKIASKMYTEVVQPTVQNLDTAFVLPLRDLSGYDQLVDDRTYSWKVRARDAEDVYSEWSASGEFFFNKINTAPLAPNTGFNPQDSVTVSSLYPSFSWNTAADPDLSDITEMLSYTLQVAGDFEFSEILYEFETDPGQTSVTWEIGPVEDNSILYYRVKTMDDEGAESGWSQFWVFFINTALDPPVQFLVNSPAPDDTLFVDGEDTQIEVSFYWKYASDPDYRDMAEYFVAISNEEVIPAGEEMSLNDLMQFDTVLATGIDTTYITSLSPGTYWWAVAAVDSDSLWCFGTDQSGEVLQHLTILNPSSIASDGQGVVSEFQLTQNYPNPFNPSTTIRYGLVESGFVTINVYDLNGRLVKTLVQQEQPAGWHSVQWAGKNIAGKQVSAGLYLYSIQAGTFRDLKKMMLLK